MEFTEHQNHAVNEIVNWYGSGHNLFILAGYAGTGKTTVISDLRSSITARRGIAYVAFTAKATSVLRSKLEASNAMKKMDYCGTIHSLIYKPMLDKKSGKILGWQRRDCLIDNYSLIVVDEASMIDKYTFKDLQSFDVPIILVGDKFQLPPVSGQASLMDSPDYTLTEIHRQAADNPIIKLSMHVRKKGYIPYGVYSPSVVKVHKQDTDVKNKFIKSCDKLFSDTMILSSTNKTRIRINTAIRKMLGRNSDVPEKDDKVICLKNNYNAQDCPIFNGSLGYINHCSLQRDAGFIEAIVDIMGESLAYNGPICPNTFNNAVPEMDWKKKVKRVFWDDRTQQLKSAECPLDYFDYGYCLTVHKAQGSQAKKVMVIEERQRYMSDVEWARWLYTAVTRAENQLLVLGSD